jgi:formylglycine-generating enzyme required for sulfatase activity
MQDQRRNNRLISVVATVIMVLVVIGVLVAVSGREDDENTQEKTVTPEAALPTETEAPTDEPPTEEPTQTPTEEPTVEFTPTIQSGLPGGGPVTSNDQWTPIEQDFDGITMVLVPIGCFTMGSTEEQVTAAQAMDEEEYDFTNEQPATEICFDTPFWIDKGEVTRSQTATVTNATEEVSADAPSTNNKWEEASAYCALRGSYLPTEAQWEYAGRGPDNLLFTWGNEFVEENVARSRSISLPGEHPNDLSWVGAFDMVGNVQEWTSSKFEPYPYDSTDGREEVDPQANHVIRGGYFGSTIAELRLSARLKRGGLAPVYGGFRCARDYEPS